MEENEMNIGNRKGIVNYVGCAVKAELELEMPILVKVFTEFVQVRASIPNPKTGARPQPVLPEYQTHYIPASLYHLIAPEVIHIPDLNILFQNNSSHQVQIPKT